jgi:hypothetical protein
MRSKLLEGASLVCVYIVDNNTFINHLPMQKVTLRPDPVFMLASAHWAVSGDSLETQNYFASLALML